VTGPRAILLLCALLALLDGDVWEAVGLAGVAAVLFIAWPDGFGQRPVPFRVWFPGGRWRD
jgi:hypothetical protein